jgi:oligopeptide/dipeptide ABC transporter ATP-binding protein
MMLISHDLTIVERIAHRTAVMYMGEIAEVAETGQLMSAALHPYTQALLSSVLPPDPTARRKRGRLTGELPSAIQPPEGCPFASRCPEVQPMCKRETPLLRSELTGARSGVPFTLRSTAITLADRYAGTPYYYSQIQLTESLHLGQVAVSDRSGSLALFGSYSSRATALKR